jgi:hypothetical protein
MKTMIDNLQQKIKSYKKQIKEAEAIAALNLSNYKQVHTNLAIRSEEAEAKEYALARAPSISAAPKHKGNFMHSQS